ncbi:TetR/AcrR family transcriptional regulator C-terminal domain-containing protein [Actinomadura sp. WAC 06369]|uniref:TetR/AcrR family transcriptional regulator C-terminal domain-containing protein n=1 Tax=Actinomadura sp. WAC 06369 TaxID=2203193 RepID=UPI000F7780A1|nr:TetR/AcrR family transcriptional regulator C-terminal domain-containing protein [Actinomadura sp. WAC 06369]RSN70429.1 TetR family transcriptional regulator [Actinomadura sp. WAC 06369]
MPDRPVWLRGEPRPRRPRLSLERIVAAAVGLLDAEGVDGFSMRRLAARLDAGTMSLYEYVAAKEDVLDLALDAVLGEIDPGAGGSGPDAGAWRGALVRHVEQSRRVMRAHPWVPALVGTRPLLGPNALAGSERVFGILAGAGLAGDELTAAASAVSSYVTGFAVTENMWRARMRDPADEADLRRGTSEYVAPRADAYPVLAEHSRPEDADFDAGFRRGLDIVLDGIAARTRG